MTIIFFFLLLGIAATEIEKVYKYRNTDFTISDRHVNLTHIGNFSEYDDSFNFIIGSTDVSINLLDNPFISFNVYEMTHEWKPKISE